METRTRTDPERLRILAAQLKLWLLDLLLWLSEWMGRTLPRALRMEMRADIRRALQAARVLIVLLAMSHCAAPPAQKQTRHPQLTPRGFRRTGFLDNDLRNVGRTVRVRGAAMTARLRGVRAILDNLDIWIARVRKRLLALPHPARLVLCFMVGDRVRGLVTQSPALVDSS